jgi:hypothetical protein
MIERGMNQEATQYLAEWQFTQSDLLTCFKSMRNLELPILQKVKIILKTEVLPKLKIML